MNGRSDPRSTMRVTTARSDGHDPPEVAPIIRSRWRRRLGTGIIRVVSRAGMSRDIWYRQGLAGLPLWVWLAVDVFVGFNIGALIGSWLELPGIGTLAVMLLAATALSWWAIKIIIRRDPQ